MGVCLNWRWCISVDCVGIFWFMICYGCLFICTGLDAWLHWKLLAGGMVGTGGVEVGVSCNIKKICYAVVLVILLWRYGL